MQELDEAKPLRHAMDIDVSSRASTSRRVSRRRPLRAAVLSTSRMHDQPGRSPTERVTAFVSARGQMGPPIRPYRIIDEHEL
jgi:hypothetical protein